MPTAKFVAKVGMTLSKVMAVETELTVARVMTISTVVLMVWLTLMAGHEKTKLSLMGPRAITQ